MHSLTGAIAYLAGRMQMFQTKVDLLIILIGARLSHCRRPTWPGVPLRRKVSYASQLPVIPTTFAPTVDSSAHPAPDRGSAEPARRLGRQLAFKALQSLLTRASPTTCDKVDVLQRYKFPGKRGDATEAPIISGVRDAACGNTALGEASGRGTGPY